MRKFGLFLVILIVLCLAGGAVFLAFWDLPSPAIPTEKVLSNESFPK